MSTLKSNYRDLGEVAFPQFLGRQKYMHSFDIANPKMADGYGDYELLVTDLCRAAGRFTGEAHMTVDEKNIEPGMSQRRPGAHVDGRFMKAQQWWGHPGPAWLHLCNHLPVDRMSVIVAADIAGCIAYAGEFDGTPKNNGDLEHIRAQLGTGELLPANRAFLLSPDCVHESVRFFQSTQRSFLRLALP